MNADNLQGHLIADRDFQGAIVLVGVLICLHTIGFFYPGSLNWGYHFLGFLPPLYITVYIIVAVGCLWFSLTGKTEGLISVLANFMVKKPGQFLALLIAIFTIVAVALKISAPLLGDSFYLVKNYADAFRGMAPLYPRNEPLATYYFSVILNVLGSSTYAQFMRGFLIGDIILGIGFIINVFLIVRNLFADQRCRLLSLGSLLVIPYMQLFFGYVETYSVVLFVLSLYILTVVVYLKGHLPFSVVALCFLLLALVHYLTLLLLPSLLFLAYLEYKARGRKQVILGFGGAALIIAALLLAVNFDAERFSSAVPHHHYLSASPPANAFDADTQPYTLFSWLHLNDLANYVILMSPGFLYLIFLSLFSDRLTVLRSALNSFFFFSIVPVFLMLFLVKFDLGAAKDWDVFAPYSFLVVLCAAHLYLHRTDSHSVSIYSLIVLVSLLSSFFYVRLNSMTDVSLKRYKALLDKRTLSHFSFYASATHLARYYNQVHDSRGAIETWDQFTRLYPSDPRPYQNLIANLLASDHQNLGRVLDTYERWMAADSQNVGAKSAFHGFCMDAGNDCFHNGDLNEAKLYYTKAIELEPGTANGYNNLGSVLAEEGVRDTAKELFRKAIELNPAYAEALYNLGNVYADEGDKTRAKAFYEKAARLDNPDVKKFLGDSTHAHSSHHKPGVSQ